MHGGMDANARWDYFSKVVKVEDISITSGKLDFSRFDQGDVWVAIIFFLFNDMLGALSRSRRPAAARTHCLTGHWCSAALVPPSPAAQPHTGVTHRQPETGSGGKMQTPCRR